jgi:hypothetical protein
MAILPIGSIGPIVPIIPITPIKRKKQQKTRSKGSDIILDENLGKKIDITIKGPLKAPNCFECVYYYVTWDSNFPHGCKKFEFKRKDGLPSLSVYEATSCHCQFFKKNQKGQKR